MGVTERNWISFAANWQHFSVSVSDPRRGESLLDFSGLHRGDSAKGCHKLAYECHQYVYDWWVLTNSSVLNYSLPALLPWLTCIDIPTKHIGFEGEQFLPKVIDQMSLWNCSFENVRQIISFSIKTLISSYWSDKDGQRNMENGIQWQFWGQMPKWL